jgi:hypothetical protein
MAKFHKSQKHWLQVSPKRLANDRMPSPRHSAFESARCARRRLKGGWERLDMNRKKGGGAAPAQTEPVKVQAPVPTSARRSWGNRLIRWGASVWVIAHFTAVLAAASSVGPTSPLIIEIWKPFRPYLQALYLNHGYSFYAPQPSPTTLLAYEVERPDGTVARGRILDRTTEPRLLYHRYLLLTEHMGLIPPAGLQDWYKSYARHLCHKFGGKRVGLTRLIHYPATMEMVRSGAGLNDPLSYEELFVGDFSCNEL